MCGCRIQKCTDSLTYVHTYAKDWGSPFLRGQSWVITFRVFPHNVSEEGQGQLCVGPIEQALQLWPGHEVTETADVHPHLLQSVRLCRGGGQACGSGQCTNGHMFMSCYKKNCL